MSFLALLAATTPLPPQLPLERTAEDVTLPIVVLACVMEDNGGAKGRLAFETRGGRAFAAKLAPEYGQEIEYDADFRRTEQVLEILHDDLRILSGAQMKSVRISKTGGEIIFRSRLSGRGEAAWWRFAVIADAEAGYRAALINASGVSYSVTGSCDMRHSPQAPLDQSEIAMKAAK